VDWRRDMVVLIAGKSSMPKLDPVCLFHGLKRSEHVCLFCCLCFEDLTPEECNLLPDGTREDVCHNCFRGEALIENRMRDDGMWPANG